MSSWSCLTVFRGEAGAAKPEVEELLVPLIWNWMPACILIFLHFVGVSTICSPDIMRYGVKTEILLDPLWQ